MKYVVKTILYDIAEQDPQVDNYTNENAAQNPTSQARIRTLATQNSHHDQFSDPDCLRDNKGRKLLIL